MSIRLLALSLFVAGLSIYAWKDWFKSLCGLILMMAVIHHEDMPTTMFGIQGLNPWNMLFVSIFLAWLIRRCSLGWTWDMPPRTSMLLLMYLGVIVVGFLRAVFDRSNIQEYTVVGMVSEELINTVKWILPGVLIFDGCRTRRRVITVVVCLLCVYFVLSAQIVRNMPFESAFGGGYDIQYTRLKVCQRVGYSACDTSAMFAGASWSVVAALSLLHGKKYKVLLLSVAAFIVFAQLLTGGRAGYVAWAGVGLVLCVLKWRKYLLLAPVIVLLLPAVFPGATERMLQGFGQVDVAGKITIDENAVTSDRMRVWPYVIDEICKSPAIGYGRLAMKRIGLVQNIEAAYPGTNAPHPHNMYLETLLDNGILGSLPIFIFWGVAIWRSGVLFRTGNRLYVAVGGLSLSLILAQAFAGIGDQHVYPRESTVCVWVAMFLSLRVYVEEKRALMGESQGESSWRRQLLRPQMTDALVGT